MGVRIVYSIIARNDLNEIYDFIRRDSIFYAKKEIHEIRKAIKTLKNNSFGYKVFEDLEDELIREFVFKNYRIIYRITPDVQIDIVTIQHHARSISQNPAFDIED